MLSKHNMQQPATSVELRAAKIPWIGWLAHHYFFVIERQTPEQTSRHRWEVWQRPDQCAGAVGHLHQDLLAVDAGVGWGASWLVRRWRGDEAIDLAARIEGQQYDACHEYHYWPGPNSNTYAQRMLGDMYRLPWRAVGRNFQHQTG